MAMSQEGVPLPLASWLAKAWGPGYPLHPLPDEVAPPVEASLLFGITERHGGVGPEMFDVPKSYVSLAAAHVQAQRYEDAIDSATEANIRYARLQAQGWFPVRTLQPARAAGFYNAAVSYWHLGMTAAVRTMLTNAKALLADPGAERTFEYVVVAGAVERLWNQPEGRTPLGRVLYGSEPATQLEALFREGSMAAPSLTHGAARGHAESARALGTLARVTGLTEDAVAWYTMAVNLGDRSAMSLAEELRRDWLGVRS